MPLKVSDGMGAWIDDFQKSDAPQFKGHTKEKRRDQAIAAYLSAKKGPQKESVNEAKKFYLFSNEKDARDYAKKIKGKYVKGTGKSAGKHAVIKEKVDYVGKMTGSEFKFSKKFQPKSKLPPHLQGDMVGKARKAFSKTRNQKISGTPDEVKQKMKNIKKKDKIKIGEGMATGNEPGMMFKVKVEGLPDMIMVGKSPSDIQQQLRKIVKQPSMIDSVDRMPKSLVRKMYRDLAGGKDIDENYLHDYGTPESVKMMKKMTPGENNGKVEGLTASQNTDRLMGIINRHLKKVERSKSLGQYPDRKPKKSDDKKLAASNKT